MHVGVVTMRKYGDMTHNLGLASQPDRACWPKGADDDAPLGLSENPKRIDLGKPDAAAAELSETLQSAATNSLFTRIVLTLTRSASFIGVWIIRPFIWWPIKAFLTAAVWSNTPNENSRRWQALEKDWAEQQRMQDLNRNS